MRSILMALLCGRTCWRGRSGLLARSFSGGSRGVLTRDFIKNALYNHEDGYFTAVDVINSPTPINFGNLWGEWEYRLTLKKLYQEKSEAWLTPVEIFAPHYSYALAKYILASRDTSVPLKIYEIGGGSGTNALHIMNYIMMFAPELYKKMQYTIIEISPSLQVRQRQLLSVHGGRARSELGDGLALSQTRQPDEDPCFVLALEVLDNLPHDKVAIAAAGAETERWKWMQTVVVGDGVDEPFVEEMRPLSDPLIRRTLRLFPPPITAPHLGGPGGRGHPSSQAAAGASGSWGERLRTWIKGGDEAAPTAAFIPTGAVLLLEQLLETFPRHHLVAADFDHLPPPDLRRASPPHPNAEIPALNPPIVAVKSDGETLDQHSYLQCTGRADIFFATDFSRLRAAYASMTAAQQVSNCTSADFLTRFAADLNLTRTMTGYNPLVSDYSNTQFLLANNSNSRQSPK